MLIFQNDLPYFLMFDLFTLQITQVFDLLTLQTPTSFDCAPMLDSKVFELLASQITNARLYHGLD